MTGAGTMAHGAQKVLGQMGAVKRRATVSVLVLLALSTMLTLLVVASTLRARLLEQRTQSAQVALQSVAASVLRANQLGVPLDKMVGLDELVRSRVTAASGLVSFRLLDAGHVVWRSGERSDAASNGLDVTIGCAVTRALQLTGHVTGHALEPIGNVARRAPRPPSGCTASHLLEAPVGSAGALQAHFVPPSDSGAFLRMALVVIGVAIGLAIPLLELARLSDDGREGFMAKHLRRQVEAVRRGDFRIAWRLSGAEAAGGRLPFLRDQVFLLNEQFQRVARLVGSLRRTEPDADNRARMGKLLLDLRQRFRFTDDGGVFDRRSWADADTARCFAALAVLIANLPTGFSLTDLTQWSVGLVIGARGLAVRWPTRLVMGFGVAALANLFNGLATMGPAHAAGTGWAEITGNVLAGIATTLAARAAVEAGRAYIRPVVASTLLAGTVAGPIVVFASVAALNTFVDPAWLYFTAAGMAVVTAGWLIYRVADQSVPVSRPRRERISLSPLLSGIVWSAATAAFDMTASSSTEALWLMIAQVPGLLILASARERPRTVLAAALGAIAAVWLARPLLPQAVAEALSPTCLTWLGSACIGGALGAVPDCWRAPPSRAVTGFSLGVASSLVAVYLVGHISTDAARPVSLVFVVAGTIALFIARRHVWGRMR